jgi:hypothetical protein
VDPCKRIHTRNQQATARWRYQEHASQALLTSHGNNDRGVSHPESDLRHLPPHPKIQIQQNEKEQHPPKETQTRRVHTMGQDYPLTDPSPGAKSTIYPFSLPQELR